LSFEDSSQHREIIIADCDNSLKSKIADFDSPPRRKIADFDFPPTAVTESPISEPFRKNIADFQTQIWEKSPISNLSLGQNRRFSRNFKKPILEKIGGFSENRRFLGNRDQEKSPNLGTSLFEIRNRLFSRKQPI
jgi:hypothetical protein